MAGERIKRLGEVRSAVDVARALRWGVVGGVVAGELLAAEGATFLLGALVTPSPSGHELPGDVMAFGVVMAMLPVFLVAKGGANVVSAINNRITPLLNEERVLVGRHR